MIHLDSILKNGEKIIKNLSSLADTYMTSSSFIPFYQMTTQSRHYFHIGYLKVSTPALLFTPAKEFYVYRWVTWFGSFYGQFSACRWINCLSPHLSVGSIGFHEKKDFSKSKWSSIRAKGEQKQWEMSFTSHKFLCNFIHARTLERVSFSLPALSLHDCQVQGQNSLWMIRSALWAAYCAKEETKLRRNDASYTQWPRLWSKDLEASG